MAPAGTTATGLDELRASIETLPDLVTATLRAVSWRYSRLEKDSARRILLSEIHGHSRRHQHTADSLVIEEHPEDKSFVVTVDNPEMPNLALWLERGTWKMTARPFLRPAWDALYPAWAREMVQTVTDAVTTALAT